ncbi:MAG: hypothetical protein ACRD50_00960 [Candidatus Acidiferrales bacterium]
MADSELSSMVRGLRENVSLAALSIVKMPIRSYGWKFQLSLDLCWLMIETPWFQEKGPETAWRALADALKRASIIELTAFVVLEGSVAKPMRAID